MLAMSFSIVPCWVHQWNFQHFEQQFVRLLPSADRHRDSVTVNPCAQVGWLGASSAVCTSVAWEQAAHTCIFCFCQSARDSKDSVMAPIRVPRRLRTLLDDAFSVTKNLQALHEHNVAASHVPEDSGAADIAAGGPAPAAAALKMSRREVAPAPGSADTGPGLFFKVASQQDDGSVRDLLAPTADWTGKNALSVVHAANVFAIGALTVTFSFLLVANRCLHMDLVLAVG
jgi:hypothetical protein